MLPTVITIVIDMIVHEGFRLIIANKNAQKKRNPKTYVEFQIIKSAPSRPGGYSHVDDILM